MAKQIIALATLVLSGCVIGEPKDIEREIVRVEAREDAHKNCADRGKRIIIKRTGTRVPRGPATDRYKTARCF